MNILSSKIHCDTAEKERSAVNIFVVLAILAIDELVINKVSAIIGESNLDAAAERDWSSCSGRRCIAAELDSRRHGHQSRWRPISPMGVAARPVDDRLVACRSFLQAALGFWPRQSTKDLGCIDALGHWQFHESSICNRADALQFDLPARRKRKPRAAMERALHGPDCN